MNYYKVFINSLKSKREMFVYDEDYFKKQVEFVLENKKEWYESIFIYTDKEKEQLERTGSLAGISGLDIDRIVFDFDSKDDVQLALDDARTLVSRLSFLSETAIQCYFSGNKGFHVQINTNALIKKEEFIKIVEHYALDLSTFDQVIKDDQRVFRFPMSFNPKSGMYKIPMTAQELMIANLDDIFEQAKAPNMDERLEVLFTFETIEMPEQFIKILNYKEVKEKTKELLDLPTVVTDKPDMSRKPKHLTEAKYALQEGFFEEGERNEACMILAATYRYLGYNKELAYNMIKATLRLRAERLNLPDYDRSSLWKEVINPVYSPTWKGGTFSEDTGVLKKVIDRYGLNKINTFAHELISLENVSDFFKDFALNIDKNTLKIGIEEIDAKLRITTGMLVSLLAAPSAGKSSIAMSILNTVSKNDCKCLFFSLDMSMQQTYQRLIQKHTGHQSDEIFEAYKQGNDEITNQYMTTLKDEYKNVKFSFRSGLTVDGIREMIINEQNLTGVIPKLVVIDYLECIHGQFSDPTANKALIATQLKDIANQFSICVMLLVQPRLAAGGPAGELNSYTDIKGSGVIGESSAVVLTLSRPGFNPKDSSMDKFATITVVKNRMGSLSSTDLGWVGLTGNVSKLDDQGRRDLEDLRSALANQNESDEEYAGRTSGFRPFKSQNKKEFY